MREYGRSAAAAVLMIRFDLFPPGGPFSGEPPASDELRLEPTLDWIEAALPQQNSELLDALDNAVEIRLTGAAGRDAADRQG